MTDLERLTALLDNAPADPAGNRNVRTLAEYLLANGVIVPPCKVGDTLYDIYGNGNFSERKVTEINVRLDKRNKPWLIICGYFFAFEDFGKNVFLTREEAERALKGGAQE